MIKKSVMIFLLLLLFTNYVKAATEDEDPWNEDNFVDSFSENPEEGWKKLAEDPSSLENEEILNKVFETDPQRAIEVLDTAGTLGSSAIGKIKDYLITNPTALNSHANVKKEMFQTLGIQDKGVSIKNVQKDPNGNLIITSDGKNGLTFNVKDISGKASLLEDGSLIIENSQGGECTVSGKDGAGQMTVEKKDGKEILKVTNANVVLSENSPSLSVEIKSGELSYEGYTIKSDFPISVEKTTEKLSLSGTNVEISKEDVTYQLTGEMGMTKKTLDFEENALLTYSEKGTAKIKITTAENGFLIADKKTCESAKKSCLSIEDNKYVYQSRQNTNTFLEVLTDEELTIQSQKIEDMSSLTLKKRGSEEKQDFQSYTFKKESYATMGGNNDLFKNVNLLAHVENKGTNYLINIRYNEAIGQSQVFQINEKSKYYQSLELLFSKSNEEFKEVENEKSIVEALKKLGVDSSVGMRKELYSIFFKETKSSLSSNDNEKLLFTLKRGIQTGPTLAEIKTYYYTEKENNKGENGYNLAALLAIAEQESSLAAFDENGKITTRFECAHFKELSGQSSCPQGSGRSAFEEAYKIDPKAAVLASSFGSHQVLGEFVIDKYDGDTEALLKDIETREGASYELFFYYIEHHYSNNLKSGGISAELKKENPDWATVAMYYNGGNYKQNQYDTKVREKFEAIKKQQEEFSQIVSTASKEGTI